MNMPRMRTCSFPLFTFTLCLLTLTLGRSRHLFYPKASTYLDQAKGSSGAETIDNLIGMLEEKYQGSQVPAELSGRNG